MLVRALAPLALASLAVASLLLIISPLGSPFGEVSPRTHAQDGGAAGSPVNLSRAGDIITFNAPENDATQVSLELLTDAPPRYLFTANQPMNVGGGCTAVSEFSGYCSVLNAPGQIVSLNLGGGGADGNDTATIRGSRDIDFVSATTGPQDDLVIIDSDGAATGPVVMTGGTGSFDELWLDDLQSPGGRTYTVAADSITRTGSGGYSHAGVETVKLFGGDGTDVTTVNATAATVTHFLYTGAGSDTTVVGNTNLDPIDGVIWLDAGANSDFLTIRDTGTGNNQVFDVSATFISRGGWGGINYTDVGSIFAEGGGGHDQWNISGAGAALNISGGNGIDVFTVGDNLDDLAAPITVNGQGNIDQLNIDDRANTTPVEYTTTLTDVHRNPIGGGIIRSIQYEAIEGIQLDTQDAASEIWLALSAAPLLVNAHGGNDQIIVGDGTINNLTHNVNVFGGTGTDSIVVEDSALVANDTYDLDMLYLNRTGAFGQLQYQDVEAFTLNAQQGDNLIAIESTVLGGNYTINGGPGTDNMRVGFSNGLEFQFGGIFFHGGDGFDYANAWDNTAFDNSNTYELRAGRMQRIALQLRPAISYDTTEQVALLTGDASDTVHVLGTSGGISTAVVTNLGSDVVSVVAAGLPEQGTGDSPGGGGAGTGGFLELNGGFGDFDNLYFHDNGLGHTDNGSIITTPGKVVVSHALFENRPVFASDADTDDDGCPDVKEGGTNRVFGGERSPFDFYDWYDVAGPGGPRDGAIDLQDTIAILARFGAHPTNNPELYDPNFDREQPYPQFPWRPGLANGSDDVGIDLQDALLNLQSFGHSCV